MDLAFAKKAGKVWIAAPWMKRRANVFPIVRLTEFLTLKPNSAVVSKAGLEMTVGPNCATLIVVHMAGQFTIAQCSVEYQEYCCYLDFT